MSETVRLLSELHVSGAVVGGIDDVGEGSNLDSYRLSREEMFKAYADYLPQFVEDKMPLKHIRLGAAFEYRDKKFSIPFVRDNIKDLCSRVPICLSMRNTMYLGPDGYIMPCIPMSYHEASEQYFPNVSEISLSDALSDSAYLKFINLTVKDYFEANPKCRDCSYAKLCAGGCRGAAAQASQGKDLMGKDPYGCWYFLGGYYERSLEILNGLNH